MKRPNKKFLRSLKKLLQRLKSDLVKIQRKRREDY